MAMLPIEVHAQTIMSEFKEIIPRTKHVPILLLLNVSKEVPTNTEEILQGLPLPHVLPTPETIAPLL